MMIILVGPVLPPSGLGETLSFLRADWGHCHSQGSSVPIRTNQPAPCSHGGRERERDREKQEGSSSRKPSPPFVAPVLDFQDTSSPIWLCVQTFPPTSFRHTKRWVFLMAPELLVFCSYLAPSCQMHEVTAELAGLVRPSLKSAASACMIIR